MYKSIHEQKNGKPKKKRKYGFGCFNYANMSMNQVQIETIFDSITPIKTRTLIDSLYYLQINMFSLGLAILIT